MDCHRGLPAVVVRELENLDAHWRRTAALGGCGRLLVLGTVLLVGSLIGDLLLDFEAVTRSWLLAGLMLTVAGYGWMAVIRPLVQRVPPEDLAALAERRFPELRERLTSLVELSSDGLAEGERGSPLMRELLQRETERAVSRRDLLEAVESGRAVRPAIAGMVAVAACLFCWLLLPSPSRLLLARLVNPLGNYESAGPLTFEIAPDDCVIGRGDDLTVAANVLWRDQREQPVPEPVTLLWENQSGQQDRRQLPFDADSGRFVTVIPDAQESFRIRVQAGGFRSRAVSVQVEDVPQVVTAVLEATPPAYRGLPRLTFDGVTGEMTVPEHSQLRFELTFNKPVERAELEWIAPRVIPPEELVSRQSSGGTGDGERSGAAGGDANGLIDSTDLPSERLKLSGDRLSASLELPATVQGNLAFRLTDEHGLRSPEEPWRHLKIERDQPPELNVPGGRHDTARPSDIYPLNVQVTDDIGVEALELWITARDGLKIVRRVGPESLGVRSLDHRFRVDLADLDIAAGTILRLQVRAADGRPVPGPNEVWSEIRYVAVADSADAPGTRGLLAEQEQLRSELKSIRESLEQATEDSDRLAEQAAGQPESSVDQTRIQELAEREADLSRQLQQLALHLRERPLFDRVAGELDRTASAELAPAAGRLQSAAGQSAREQANSLRENADVTDMAAEQLLDMESRFDRLAQLEQDLLELNRIADRAARLAEDAERLGELYAELDTARQPNGNAEQTPENAEAPETEAQNAEAQNGDRGAEDTEPAAASDSRNAEQLDAAHRQLATARQELRNEHQELAEALGTLLDRRPEVLEAAREQQLQRLQQLAQQAASLADREELLADALAGNRAGTVEQRAETPSGAAAAPAGDGADRTATPESAAGPPGESSPVGSEEPDAQESDLSGNDPRGNDPRGSDPRGSDAPGSDAPESDVPAVTAGRTPEAAAIAELLDRQRALAAEAAELGLAVSQTAGEASAEAQAAIESAARSQEAQRLAEGGQFDGAAEQSRQAAASAGQVQSDLAEHQPALARRAAEVAEAQRQLAADLDALQQSPQLRAAAQQMQQEQIADAAGILSDQLEEISQSLTAQPLSLADRGQQAEQAQQATDRARQSAAQTLQQLQNSAPADAADTAAETAQLLREAAARAAGEPVENSAAAGSTDPGRGDPAATAGEPSTGEPASRERSTGEPGAGEPGPRREAEGSPAADQASPVPPASAAPPASAVPSDGSGDVPGQLATQVVSAAQQLMQAQQQLSEALRSVPSALSGDARGAEAGIPGDSPGRGGQEADSSSSPAGGQAADAKAIGAGQEGARPAEATPAGGTPDAAGPSGETASPGGRDGQGDVAGGQSGRDGHPGGPTGQQPGLASESLRRAAQALAAAAEKLAGAARQITPPPGSPSGESGRGMSNGANQQMTSALGNSGTGAAAFEEAGSPLEQQLRRQAMREWGRLPPKIRTEILQSRGRSGGGEYAEIIKLYFEQIAAEQAAQPASAVP